MSNVPTLKKLLVGEVTLAATLDYIEAKVVEQGYPALNNDGSCVYLTETGEKCAIGHLLTEEDHLHGLKGLMTSLFGLLALNHEYFEIKHDTCKPFHHCIDNDDTTLRGMYAVLHDVQCAHDDRDNHDDFVNKFKAEMAFIRENHADLIAKY
jgi:hypothetical protein